jgi:hypothetical protein
MDAPARLQSAHQRDEVLQPACVSPTPYLQGALGCLLAKSLIFTKVPKIPARAVRGHFAGILGYRRKDAALGHAIRAERERRMLNGTATREAACRHFVKAPGILDQIMTDAYSNPRHKIEAIRELRQTAIGDNIPTEGNRFIIKIDLTAGGGDVTTYNKSKKIDASDGDGPNNLIPLEGKPDVDE